MAKVYIQTLDGVRYLESAHTPDFVGNPFAAINPASIPNCELRFMKVENGVLMEMSPEEKDAALVPERNAAIKAQIEELEKRQLRSTREYLLGDASALSRLQDLDIQIAALRAQFK